MRLRSFTRRKIWQVRKVHKKFLSMINRPHVEIKLSMIKLNLKLTHALLRVGADKLLRV